MADPVAPAARLAGSVSISISISNPKRKRPKLGVSQNRSALTWAKGIQIEIEIEIVSRWLNLKHQTAEVSGQYGLRLRWIIQEEPSVSCSGTGIPARDGSE